MRGHQPHLLTPTVAASIAIFLISVTLFVHQCILPLRTLGPLSLHSAWVPPAPSTAAIAAAAVPPPHPWFHAAGADADAGAGAGTEARPALENIPHGPVALPALATPRASVPAGSSWTAALAHGLLSGLPLHWAAEAAHAAGAGVSSEGDRAGSIFSGRRKGAWIGCRRPFHLVCKGVYRAIKRVDAVRVVSLDCARDAAWLPHVVRKLEAEFRMVRVVCVGGTGGGAEWRGVARVSAVDRKVVTSAAFPSGSDLVVAYGFLRGKTMIEGVRFLKKLRDAGTVRYLAVESFVGGSNEAGRFNLGVAPFWFPGPVFVYQNEEENEEDEPVHIVVVRVAELFQERNTPMMKDLVDPRKREVRE